MSRADINKLAENAGATTGGSVTGKTTHLVAGPGAGSKEQAAIAKGVAIWSEADFFAAMGGVAPKAKGKRAAAEEEKGEPNKKSAKKAAAAPKTKGKGKAAAGEPAAAAASSKKATYDVMVQEALITLGGRNGPSLAEIKKKMQATRPDLDLNVASVKTALKKGIAAGSIVNRFGGYKFMSEAQQAGQGKTWVCLAFHSGSGCVPGVTTFQSLRDLEFFNGKDSCGAPPTSYHKTDSKGYSFDLELPVLSLDEAKKLAKPLLNHKTEADTFKSEKVVKQFKNFCERLKEEDMAPKRLEAEGGGPSGLGVVVVQAGDDHDNQMPFVVKAADEAALRAYLKPPNEGEVEPWGFADVSDAGGGYYTRKYMDDHAEDIDEEFEMVKREHKPWGPPGCL
jgi:hypothetical protein